MASRFTLAEITATYQGSDGEATKALYAELEALGPAGFIATNIFRACKASERAKVYRGSDRSGRGSYRAQAYERKRWAIENLTVALKEHAKALELIWGWQKDPAEEIFPWVLYIDTPSGQISYHNGMRGPGPDYPGAWDQIPGMAPSRVCRWAARLLRPEDFPAAPEPDLPTCAISQVAPGAAFVKAEQLALF